MLDHVRPQYAKKFQCIGSECEDHCCHGWLVTIDKDSYLKYQATPALRKMLDECFVLSSNPTVNRYAVFKHTLSTNCPMFSSDRLCSIHKEYGADYLPKTCATYPRATRRIDGLLEHPLFLSCPEAARLVLLDPQLMSGKEGVVEDRKYFRLLAAMGESIPAHNDPFRYFWEGREFSLLLTQDRRYPLWQRLFILGMFCKRLDTVIADPRAGSVPKLLRDYAEIAAQGKLRAAMDGIPPRPAVQLKMVLDVVKHHLTSQDPRFCRFLECLQDFLHGTGNHDAAQKLNSSAPQVTFTLDLDSSTSQYVEAYDRYYAPFMERHPFLLENYLINYILMMRFPFPCNSQGQFISPQQQFLLLCLEFAVIKGLLIGMAGHSREKFAPEHVVKLIQAVAKSIEHSETFVRALNWQGLADSNSVAALLKN